MKRNTLLTPGTLFVAALVGATLALATAIPTQGQGSAWKQRSADQFLQTGSLPPRHFP